jgi:hypothetical protein
MIRYRREPWWNDIDRKKLLICSPELLAILPAESYNSKEAGTREQNNDFALRGVFVHTSKGF